MSMAPDDDFSKESDFDAVPTRVRSLRDRVGDELERLEPAATTQLHHTS